MAEWRLSLPVLYLFSEASMSVHLRARQAAPRALAMPVLVVNIKFPAGTDFPHSDQLEWMSGLPGHVPFSPSLLSQWEGTLAALWSAKNFLPFLPSPTHPTTARILMGLLPFYLTEHPQEFPIRSQHNKQGFHVSAMLLSVATWFQPPFIFLRTEVEGTSRIALISWTLPTRPGPSSLSSKISPSSSFYIFTVSSKYRILWYQGKVIVVITHLICNLNFSFRALPFCEVFVVVVWWFTQAWSEKEMAAQSSILAWEIPWTEELGGIQPMGLQRAGHDWVTKDHMHPSSIFLALVLVRRYFGYEGFQVVVWLRSEHAKQSVILPESWLTYFSLS